MSVSQQQEVDRGLPQAPLEPVPSFEVPYTKEIIMTCIGSTADDSFKIDTTLNVLIQDQLQDMGTVFLHEFSIKIMPKKAGSSVYFGVSIAGSNKTAQELAGADEGFMFVANAYNVGVPVIHKVVVPGLFSRQIQPVSATHPSFRIVMDVSKDTYVTCTFKIKHIGVVRSYIKKSF